MMSGTNPFRRKNIHEEEPDTLRQEHDHTYHQQFGAGLPTIDTGQYHCVESIPVGSHTLT